MVVESVQLTAVHDPVPATSSTGVCGDRNAQPHRLETQIQRWLLMHSQLKFVSLVVRGIPGGICIEGVLEGHDSLSELERILKQLPGVDRVINNVRCCPSGDCHD